MIINHNLAANNAIRNMNVNNNNASKSMQKLSSGLRINSAADDAAGLAISEKMKAQISGLDQASSNAQNGISLAQTAEGALSETTSILQRMRELAVQSSTDTNTAEDRAKIQSETDELAKEVTRISNTTEFNTQNLLAGGLTDTFQIGANQDQNITLKIGAMDAKSLGITRDVSAGSIDPDNNAAKISTVSADAVDVTKALTDGKYKVALTATDAGATSALDATGKTVTGLVTGTATADTSITLTYTDHGTAAVNTATSALAATSTSMTAASSLKVNGTTVDLNAVKALGTLASPQTSENDVVTALQTDLDTTLGSGKYTVSVDGSHKLSITSVATGSATKVSLSGSDSASAALLGFSSTAIGTNGAATGGIKDWVAAGSLGGVVSSNNNTVNGVTIDQTKLSTTAAVGDTIAVKGYKDATLAAQLSSVGTGVAAVTNSTTSGATVGTDTVTGTATANTSVALKYNEKVEATVALTTGLTLTAVDGSSEDGAAGNLTVTISAVATGAATVTVTSTVLTLAFSAGTTLSAANIQALLTANSAAFTVGTSAGTLAGSAAFTLAGGSDTGVWNLSGADAGTAAGTIATTATVNGLTIDVSKITGTATDKETLTIKASVSADIGKAVTVDQKNGGSYVLGDATGAGQMKVGFDSATATAGTSTINLTTSNATAAVISNGKITTDAQIAGGIDVSTQSKASTAITTIQTAIEKVSAERSKLGAYQNRLEHTIANLGTSSENLTSAESRITDVDMAKEMSTYSKNNILSQAAQAMLAQANQQPQQVLQLLK